MENVNHNLDLISIKSASLRFGVSKSFINRLLRSKDLTRYKIRNKTFVSAIEFERLAKPVAA